MTFNAIETQTLIVMSLSKGFYSDRNQEHNPRVVVTVRHCKYSMVTHTIRAFVILLHH